MVQVVSMLLVIIRLGEMAFQSKLVNGALESLDLEFDSRARAVSFCVGGRSE